MKTFYSIISWLSVSLVCLVPFFVQAQDSHNAFSTDGNDILVQQNPGFNFNASKMTAMAWIYPTSTSGVKTIMSHMGPRQWSSTDDFQAGSWQLYVDNGKISFKVYSSTGSKYYTTTVGIAEKTWTHVAVRTNNGAHDILINGQVVLKASGEKVLSLSSIGPLFINFQYYYYPTPIFVIGAHFSYSQYYTFTNYTFGSKFVGQIDEVQIWNDLLNLEEIQEAMFSRIKTSDSRLLTSYNMDQGSSNTADYISNDKNTAIAYRGLYYYDNIKNAINGDEKGSFISSNVLRFETATSLASDNPTFKRTTGNLSIYNNSVSSPSITGSSAYSGSFITWRRANDESGYTSDDIEAGYGVESRFKEDFQFLNSFAGYIYHLRFDLSAKGLSGENADGQGNYVLLEKDNATSTYHPANYVSGFREKINGKEYYTVLSYGAYLEKNKFYTLGKLSNDFNGVASFDGVNDVAYRNLDLSSVNYFTVELSAKSSSYASQSLLSHNYLTSTTGFALGLEPDKNRLVFSLGLDSFYHTSPIYSKGEWLHYAVEVDNVNKKMVVFVNGSPVITLSNKTYKNNSYLYVGQSIVINGQAKYFFFKGNMDELRVWNTLRTTEEIQNGISTRVLGSDPNLLLYNRFDDLKPYSLLIGNAYNQIGTARSGLVLEEATDLQLLPDNENSSPTQGGRALVFNGINQYVSASYMPEYYGKNLTVEATVKPAADNSNGKIITQSIGTKADRFGIELQNGYPIVYFQSQSGSYLDSIKGLTTLAKDQWYHLAATFNDDGNSVAFYVNGIPQNVKSTTNALSTVTGNLYVGGKSGLTCFEGEIDQVRLWDTAFTIGGIWSIKDKVTTGLENNLVLDYDFDFSANGKIKDRSANFNHGSLQNFSGTIFNWVIKNSTFETELVYQSDTTTSSLNGLRIKASNFAQTSMDILLWGSHKGSSYSKGKITDYQWNREWFIDYYDENNNYTEQTYLYFNPTKAGVNMDGYENGRFKLLFKSKKEGDFKLVDLASTTVLNNGTIVFEIGVEQLIKGYYTFGFSEPSQGLAFKYDYTTARLPITTSGNKLLQTTHPSFQSEITLEFWVKAPSNPSEDIFVAGFDQNGNYYSDRIFFFQIDKNTNDLSFYFKGPQTNSTIAKLVTTELSPNEWTHIAWVFKQANYSSTTADYSLYKNGKLAVEKNNQSRDQYFFYSAGSYANNSFFVGDNVPNDSMLIDELRIWNKARTSQEILENYASLKPIDVGANLMLHINFDDYRKDQINAVKNISNVWIPSKGYGYDFWQKATWYQINKETGITTSNKTDSTGGLTLYGDDFGADYLTTAGSTGFIKWSYSGEGNVVPAPNLPISARMDRSYLLIHSNTNSGDLAMEFNLTELGLEELNQELTFFLLYGNEITTMAPTAVKGIHFIKKGDNQYIRFLKPIGSSPDGYYSIGWSNDRFNKGIELAKTNDGITGSATSKNKPSTISIECWIKPEALHQNQVIYSLGNIELSLSGNNSFKVKLGVNDSLVNTVAASKDKWYHLAFTHNNSGQGKLYVNGSLAVAKSGIANPVFSNLDQFVGSDSLFGHNGNFVIDDLRIWNIVKTDSAIAASQKSILSGNESGLWALYRFNEANTASLIPDYVSPSAHLSGVQFESTKNWVDVSNRTDTLNGLVKLKTSGIFSSGGMTIVSPMKLGYVSIAINNSAFNADIVANKDSSMASTTSANFNGYTFFEKGFNTAIPDQGLPVNGKVNSATIAGLTYNLQSYSGKNAARIAYNNGATFEFIQPTTYSKLSFLGASTDGNSALEVYVTYSDNSSVQINTSTKDWYNGTPYAINGLGRVDITTGIDGSAGSNPRLYDHEINVDSTKAVKNVYIKNTSSGTLVMVLAIAGRPTYSSPVVISSALKGYPSITSYGFIKDKNDQLELSYLNKGTWTKNTDQALPEIEKVLSRKWLIEKVDQNNDGGLLYLTIDLKTVGMSDLLHRDFTYYLLGPAQNGTGYQSVKTFSSYLSGTTNSAITFIIDANNMPSGYYTLGVNKGGWGYALELDGTNDFVDLGNAVPNYLKGSNSFTIETWVKPITGGYVFSKGTSNGIYLGINEEGTVFAKRGTKQITSKESVNFGKYNHLAMNYDGDSLRLYVNGKIAARTTQTESITFSKLVSNIFLGTYDNIGVKSGMLQGQIEDIKIWNRALASYEIRNSQLTNRETSNDLVLNIRFNQVNTKYFPNNTSEVLFAKTTGVVNSQTGIESGLEYVYDAKEVNNAKGTTNQVKELAMSSFTSGSKKFFKNDEDLLFFGYTSASGGTDTTLLPEMIEERLTTEWKIAPFDYLSDGGTVKIEFKKTDEWPGADAEQTYYLLFRPQAAGKYSNFNFSKYSTDVSSGTVTFEVDALNLKTGNYALGYAKTTQLLTASDSVSDANIYVKWKIPAYCFNNNDGKPVWVELSSTRGKVLYKKRLDSFSFKAFYVDSFTHKNDISYSDDYEVNIYRIGLGNKICKDLFKDKGYTDDFRKPEVTKGPVKLNKNIINWNNLSDHNYKYRITRHSPDGDTTIITLDSIDVSYADSIIGESTDLINGANYTYCVEVQDTRLGKFYPAVCVDNHSFDVNFNASDDATRDTVILTWNSVDSLTDELVIYRDGDLLTVLPSTDNSFMDYNPIHGQRHLYEIQLFKNRRIALTLRDTGSVKPIGVFTGRVTTLSGDYGVPDCSVKLTATVNGSDISYTTVSDATGYFAFENVFFGQTATLSINPALTGHSFAKTDYTVSLSGINSQVLNYSVQSIHNYLPDGKRMLSNFNMTIDKSVDNAVNLSWSIASKLPVLYQVYRGDSLLTILNNENSFTDNEITPGVSYTYRVNAYILTNDSITETSKTGTVVTNSYTPITDANFKLSSNPGRATVDLSWEYAATNIDGYVITRNGNPIAETTENAFVDLDGTNGIAYTYGVSPYRDVNGARYLAKSATKSVTYPLLDGPKKVKLVPNSQTGGILGNFEHQVAGNYNFKGYSVSRVKGTDTVLIAQIGKGKSQLFFDTTGLFGNTYTYLVSAYKNGKLGRSSASSATAKFPNLPDPVLVSHSEIAGAKFSYIVKWDSKTQIYGATQLTSATDTVLIEYGRQAKIYSVEPSYSGAATQKQYLSTVVWRGGSKFVSKPIELTTNAEAEEATLTDITNFSASENYTGYVLLSWKYPEYVRPYFFVYRDGKLIDSLQYDQRSYLDFGAQQGAEHCYMIRAVYQASTPITYSKYAIDYGKIVSSQILCGTVVNQYTKNGVESVKITASGANGDLGKYHKTTTTDQTGYYAFNDIPAWDKIQINVNADRQNYFFDPQKVTIQKGVGKYTVDFVDTTYVSQAISTSEIAKPTVLVLIPDEASQTMSIRYNIAGQNYTGVELLRGTKVIATLSKGRDFSYIDSSGIPNYTYTYSVRAFWEFGGTKLVSDQIDSIAIFPTVLPVSLFKATVNDSLNYTQLLWAHPNNRLDHFEITRNGILIATLDKNQYNYFDQNGQPGNNYKYHIVAVKTVENKEVKSVEVAQKAAFPYLTRVDDFTSTANAAANAVSLSWTHHLDKIDGYYLYRDGKLATKLETHALSVSFTDSFGLPAINHKYSVVPYMILDEQTYKAPARIIRQVYPIVAGVTGFSAKSIATSDMIRLTWAYSTSNIDGFDIYRDKVLLVSLSGNSTSYEDITGLPNTTYEYEIVSFNKRNDKTYYSSKSSSKAVFPKVSKPSSFYPSQMVSSSYYRMYWSHSAWEKFTEEERGYEIERTYWPITQNSTGVPSGTVNVNTAAWKPSQRIPYTDRTAIHSDIGKMQNFAHYYNGNAQSAWMWCDHTRIRSYRVINGKTYYSDWVYGSKAATSKPYPRDYNHTLTATNGTEKGAVKISWINQWDISSYNYDLLLYREDMETGNAELIAKLDNSTTSYIDRDGIPGKKYIYEAYLNYQPFSSQFPSNYYPRGGADIGWSPGDGRIEGKVFTRQTGDPVAGVKVIASAKIYGELFTAETTTDNDGTYKFTTVPYEKQSTNYTINASLASLRFSNNNQTIKISENDNNLYAKPIYNLDAYVIKGRITYRNTEVPLDSVSITMTSLFSDLTENTQTVLTDEKGNYSFTYNPFADGLEKITIKVSPYIVWMTRSNRDTTRLMLEKSEYVMNSVASASPTTVFNFSDTTLYDVDIAIGTPCGSLPGSNKFTVNVQSIDGVYNEQFETNNIGKTSVKLPPLKFEAAIVEVSPLNINNFPYISYLSTIIKTIDIENQFYTDQKNRIFVPNSTLNAEFTYHNAPEIKVYGFTQYCGGKADYPAVLVAAKDEQSTKSVTLRFDVTENHGKLCNVSNGFLVIKNSAIVGAKDDTILVDAATGKFKNYSFKPNNPNPSFPHYRSIIVEYHDVDKGYQGELISTVIVTGVSALPGNDIVIDPTNNGDFQIPLFILRDPDGDGSSSSLGSGTSVNTSFDKVKTLEAGLEGQLEFGAVIFGFGTKFTLKAEANAFLNRTYSDAYTISMSRGLATLSDEFVLNKAEDAYLMGENADIIVGMGAATAYGIAWEIGASTSGDKCLLSKVQVISSGVGNIKTQWIYTVDQIKGLIAENAKNLVNLENGTYKENGKTKEETKTNLNKIKTGWEKVLDYHQRRSMPFVQLCESEGYYVNKDYNISIPKSNEDRRKKLDDVGIKMTLEEPKNSKFCKLVGATNDKNEFHLNADLVINNSVLDEYNTYAKYVWAGFKEPTKFDIPDGSPGATIAKEIFDLNTNKTFEASAKNITFSGGTSYDESVDIESSNGISYEYGANLKVSFGASTKLEQELDLGLGLGVQKGQKIAKVEMENQITASVAIGISGNKSKTTTTTNSISFNLSDNDPGDQFSVFVIYGPNVNHSPYFKTLGGRASCPWNFYADPKKATTINRDQWTIELMDEKRNIQNPTQRFINPDDPATYRVKVTNNSPFGEGRWFVLGQSNNSNKYNAFVTVFGDQTMNIPFFLNAGESDYFTCQILRASDRYVHDDVSLDFQTQCDGYFSHAELKLQAYWLNECTEVNIVSDNNWLINKTYGSEPERTVVVLGDYDPENDLLQRVELKYRRVGTKDWTTFKVIRADTLAAYYNKYLTAPPMPAQYPIFWDISHYPEILDGRYEIKADYLCEQVGWLSSNVVTGTVDRSSFQIQGLPKPSDGVLSLGEEINLFYNKDIDCQMVNALYMSAWYLKNGVQQAIQLPVTCYKNQLNFELSNEMRVALHDKILTVRVDSLYDNNGNNQKLPVEWSFRVSNNPIFWNPATISLQAYSGTNNKVSAMLEYEKFENILAYKLSNTSSWLQIIKPSGMVSLTGQNVVVNVNTNGLDNGTYTDTLIATIAGYGDLKLPITIEVLHKPPYLHINPSIYQFDMTVVANYELNGAGKTSTDTMDMVAAYIGADLRGVSKIRKFGNKYAASVNVYGNAADNGKAITFKVWNADRGGFFNATVDRNDTIYFNPTSTVTGSFTNPRLLLINTKADSIRFIPLKAGWNWLSVNLKSKTVGNAFQSLHPSDGDFVKSIWGNSEFTNQFGNTGKWVTSNGLNDIKPERGYQLFLAKADTLMAYGDTATVLSVSVNKGWNLIGYPRQKQAPINQAIALSPAPLDGDIVKSQTEIAIMDAGNWTGSLTAIKPYQAYKAKFGIANKVSWKKTIRPENWAVEAGDYEYSMTITGLIKINGELSADTNNLVGAFIDGELRGTGKLTYMRAINKYRIVVMVYSNLLTEEKVTFQVYDNKSETLYDAYDQLAFVADNKVGKLSDPYVFSNLKSTGISLKGVFEKEMVAVPNPFDRTTSLWFSDNQEHAFELTMTNSIGVVVYQKQIISTQGDNRVLLDFESMGLSDGVYFINLLGDNSLRTIKILKQ